MAKKNQTATKQKAHSAQRYTNRQKQITTERKNHSSSLILATDFLINTHYPLIDLVLESKVRLDQHIIPVKANCEAIEALPDFEKKTFKKTEQKEAILYFFNQVEKIEKKYQGEFQEHHNFDTSNFPNHCVVFKQNILPEGEYFRPYWIIFIELSLIKEIVRKEMFEEIICPIVSSINNVICNIPDFVNDNIYQLEGEKDEAEEMLKETLPEEDSIDFRDRVSYYEDFVDFYRKKLPSKEPAIFKKYTKKEIKEAWDRLANLFWRLKETDSSKKACIIRAFFNLFPVRNSKDNLGRYTATLEDEEINYHRVTYFIWERDSYVERFENELNDLVGNFPLSEPYLPTNISAKEELTLPDTTFISACREFYFEICKIYD